MAETLEPKHLEFMTIILKFTNAGASQRTANAIRYIFFKSMIGMEEANIFQNPELLSEFDKLHIKMYEADPIWFHHQPSHLPFPQFK